jgi:hypothetical protein
MGNLQKNNICINVPSSQTFRSVVDNLEDGVIWIILQVLTMTEHAEEGPP